MHSCIVQDSDNKVIITIFKNPRPTTERHPHNSGDQELILAMFQPELKISDCMKDRRTLDETMRDHGIFSVFGEGKSIRLSEDPKRTPEDPKLTSEATVKLVDCLRDNRSLNTLMERHGITTVIGDVRIIAEVLGYLENVFDVNMYDHKTYQVTGKRLICS